MENSPDFSPPHVDASRPSLGFPLGTALLLIIIFSLSGIFSCCYHWEKLRSLRRSFSDAAAAAVDLEASPEKPNYSSTKNQNQSFTVLMPGDEMPKFIALPCPCEPRRPEKSSAVEMQKHPPPPVKPPPRFPAPLY